MVGRSRRRACFRRLLEMMRPHGSKLLTRVVRSQRVLQRADHDDLNRVSTWPDQRRHVASPGTISDITRALLVHEDFGHAAVPVEQADVVTPLRLCHFE